MTDKNQIIPGTNSVFIGETGNTKITNASAQTAINSGNFSVFANSSVWQVANSSGGFHRFGVHNGSQFVPHTFSKWSTANGYIYPRQRTVYTTSQAWVPPQGNVGQLLMVMCWGGGGSGAKRNGTTGGGGGGAFTMGLFDMATILAYPNSMYIVIGAGGASQTTAGPGINGGDTRFGNTAEISWISAGGGRGGGNTGTMASGGCGGSPYGDDSAAGSPLINEFGLHLNCFWPYMAGTGIITGNTATGSGFSAATLNEPSSGVMGYGSGGGSANTTDFWFPHAAYGGGAGAGGGGAASNPSGGVITGSARIHGPGMINVQIPGVGGPGPGKSPLHSGLLGGAGGNTTTQPTNGSFPGGGGGGAAGTQNSGAGANGMVIITIF